MEYPRELNLDEDTRTRLVSYLNQEILNAKAERSPWVEDLKGWQKDYWAPPRKTENTFPFRGSSNITIPLTAIAVEALHARTMTKMFALPQLTALSLAPEFADATYDIEKALDRFLLKDLGIKKFADTSLLENKKLGTGVGKTGYEKIIRKAIRTGPTGEDEEFTVVVKQGATADPVPLANFLMPFSATDPQFAPWCGEEHTATPFRIKVLAESGFFKPEVYKNYLNWISSQENLSSSTYLREVQELQNQVPIQVPNQIGWYELYLAFDIDGDQKDEEIIVHYHLESQSIWSCRYNWYPNLRRPYRIVNYFPMEHRWAGIGIGKQNEQFQKEVTIQHRQRIDNGTIANMRMLKIKSGIGYGPGEPIFPGKIWFVDEKDDIDIFQLGEVYPSSYNNEQTAVLFSQQRTGVNENTLGMPQSGTPDSATGIAAKVQESQYKFDYTYGNEKQFISEICLDAICISNQFGVNPSIISSSNPLVQQFFSADPVLLRENIIREFNLAGQNQNRLLDRNSLTQLSGMLQQYYGGMIQISQMLGNPQVSQQIALKAMNAGTEVFKQILESFDMRNLDRLTIQPILAQLNQMMQNGMMQNGNQQPLIGAGNSGTQGPSSQ